jgi:CHAT domain-containing protein
MPAMAASGSSRDSPLAVLRTKVEQAKYPAQRIDALWELSDALSEQGLLIEAQSALRDAAVLSRDEEHRSQTALRLAAVLTAAGEIEEAQEQLTAVKASNAEVLTASDEILLHQTEGNLAARSGEFAAAEQAFEVVIAAAHRLDEPLAVARARANAIRARLDRKEIVGINERLEKLRSVTLSLPSGQERAVLLLATGELYGRAVREFLFPANLRAQAFESIVGGRSEATAVPTQAYGAGLLAQLYEDEGRNEEALRLTTAAISLAQSVNAQDQLYRWEWQAGRLQRKLGQGDESTQSFDRALVVLSGIRDDVLRSSRKAFSTSIEPLYLDYADSHLRQAAALADGSPEQQALLRKVRDELESLKQAEVQDYFENSCATGEAAKSDAINIPHTAVIYPILLSDRLEVLIETGGTLRRYVAQVKKADVTTTVRRLRTGLERPSMGDQYLKYAQLLYQWLLKEADPWLATQKVDTLVFVPSGPVRTIPLAALHDGKQFMVERYSIATTPAITLIPTLKIALPKRILVAGLSKSVQGFEELPSVDEEIRTIGTLFPGESLEDESFNLTSIRTDLTKSGFSIAHLATHGEFSADHRKSFVLTYDSRLTLDGLQAVLGRRNEPLDLLVLSACNTAAGDDRAALGLAGVAVQSGAKSALASLWSISDQATAALMGNFYKSRKAGTLTKAQSLREAQLALLQSREYGHPSYWAPYLLIGNWM